MRVINNIEEIKTIINKERQNGKKIGFVPTMGYLHEGHISLVKVSKKETDFTVMSIFVNPTQFGENEDLDKYPRDLERDCDFAKKEGVDIVFNPTVKEIYPNGYKTTVEVKDITNILCGKSRPGHFNGVTTIVNKLLNICAPDKAYFGQKDAQQVYVIKKMVTDLNMNVEIITCPIIREEDGLAMSSRNIYLNKEERKASLSLSKSLEAAKKLFLDGEKRTDYLKNFIIDEISKEKSAKIDYVEIVDAKNLDNIEVINKETLICLAVYFGTTRLIDNIIF